MSIDKNKYGNIKLTQIIQLPIQTNKKHLREYPHSVYLHHTFTENQLLFYKQTL